MASSSGFSVEHKVAVTGVWRWEVARQCPALHKLVWSGVIEKHTV